MVFTPRRAVRTYIARPQLILSYTHRHDIISIILQKKGVVILNPFNVVNAQ